MRFAPRRARRSFIRRYGATVMALCFAASAIAAAPASNVRPRLRAMYGGARPVTYIDSNGAPAGFFVDVLREAARRANIDIEWVRWSETSDSDAMLDSGTLDVIIGSATPERQRRFHLGDRIWAAGVMAAVPVASPILKEQDLQNKRLAGTLTIRRTIAGVYTPSSFVYVSSARAAAAAVCKGEAEAALFGAIYLRELLANESDACRDVKLRVVDLPLQIEYRVISRHGIEPQVERLGRAIASLTADGTLAELSLRYPALSTPFANYVTDLLNARYRERAWQIGAISAGLFVLLAVLFIAHQLRTSRRLRRLNQMLEFDNEQRRRVERALRQSEHRFRALLDAAPQTVIAVDELGVILFANARCAGMFGWSAEELTGERSGILFPSNEEDGGSPFATTELPRRARRRDGTEFPVEISLGRVGLNTGLTLALITDIAERVALEEQLRQSQKLESVGKLAGGIAHDFNNLLTIIGGYAAMALDEARGNAALAEIVQPIIEASARASSLTRQLLIFSRRQIRQPKIVSLNELLHNLEQLLRRLIGEQIEVALELDPACGVIEADPRHLEQVVMNLVVNARDAMPHGGRIVIATSALPQQDGRGERVRLRVSDTGEGIAEEIQSRVFEPFFTTKEPGKGTGLGLSVVYGIVQETGGAIDFTSRVGEGTTFELRFPCYDGVPESKPDAAEPARELRGGETVLVAEDESGVRAYIRGLLRAHGYTVLEASDGEEALARAEERDGRIDLLLTDMVMPRMGGAELAARFRSRWPGAHVLQMSGYDSGLHGADVVEKPFTARSLLSRIRVVLSSR